MGAIIYTQKDFVNIFYTTQYFIKTILKNSMVLNTKVSNLKLIYFPVLGSTGEWFKKIYVIIFSIFKYY